MSSERLETPSRLFLGVLYFVFGLNGFFTLIPVPEMAPEAERFMRALLETGYMLYLWKGVEVLAGVLLLLNRHVLVASLLVAPVTLNIFCFHLFLEPQGRPLAILLMVTNGLLLFRYRKSLDCLWEA